ncbi:MAG: hypothetical protein ACW98X_26860 [Promethearchaeota archaeon]|jgi:hypothetical protein
MTKEKIDKIFKYFEKEVYKLLKKILKKNFGININKISDQNIDIEFNIKNRRIEVCLKESLKIPAKPSVINVEFIIDRGGYQPVGDKSIKPPPRKI